MNGQTKKAAPTARRATKKKGEKGGEKSTVQEEKKLSGEASPKVAKSTGAKRGDKKDSERISAKGGSGSAGKSAESNTPPKTDPKALKKTIKSLRLSNTKARKLLNLIDVGLVFHDLIRNEEGKVVDYRIREVNPAFEAILELGAEKSVGQLASKVYGKRGRAPFLKEIVVAMESGEAQVFEGSVKSTQGRLRFSVQPMDKELFALLIEDATEEARARRRRAFLETRLKTVSAERKEALTSFNDLRAEAKNLGRQIRRLEKERDLALKESASKSTALARVTEKLEREREKNERLTGGLVAATSVSDELKSVSRSLTSALKIK